MLDKILKFIAEYNMVNSGDTVLCGLSGGADSVYLLLVMLELSKKLNITVEAIHINHHLRGSESDRDEKFCRKLCIRLRVPFITISCDVQRYAKEHSLSIEEAARNMRYGIFHNHSFLKKIATAHNADDNLETLILNITRGTALKGLKGIPPVRDRNIRPILIISRNEIENYLTSKGQDYVIDSTNLTEDYTRNKIRHRIIPVMRELNHSLIATSIKTISVLRSENELIEAQVDNVESKCLDNGILHELSNYPKVIRRRCISRLLNKNGISVSHKCLEKCDEILKNGGKINISGDLYLISDSINTELRKIIKYNRKIISKKLEIGENSIFPNIKLICELISVKNLKNINKKKSFYLLDYDKIKGIAIIRNRKFGDRIRLSERNFTSSIKKSINEKVPLSLRSTLHFIEDDEGTIFAELLGVSQRVTPDENSHRFLKITIFRGSKYINGSV